MKSKQEGEIMRTVSLPDWGRDVVVDVVHEGFTEYGRIIPYKRALKQEDRVTRRSTRVNLTDGGDTFEARSVCQPGDNFSKREGRRRAAISLLRKLPYSKVDRQAIFSAICPEYPQRN